jgi:molybdopterin synthase sulfur carrier subunit
VAEQPTAVVVTVRYFAAARAAAGIPEESVDTPPRADGGLCTVGDVLQVAVDRHGADLARVLSRCSYLLDEVAVHGRQTTVQPGQTIDVLPPFAGG